MGRMQICAALAAAGIAGALVAGPAAARELIYSSYAGPKHAVNELALPPWFKAVAEKTGGEVEWKLVTGGQLLSGRDTVAGVGEGIADAGLVVPTYNPAALPAIATIYSTLVFGDDVVATGGAALETLLLDCPACKSELKKNNAVAIAGYGATPFKLMCRKPVATLADLKGKKVRVSGSGVPMMEMAGATPVAMNPAEGTPAMERGTIDCVLGSINWMDSYGYRDVVTAILDVPMGMMGPVMTGYINRDTWDGLSREQKQALLDGAPELDARGTLDAYYGVDQEVLESLKGSDVKMYPGGKDFDAMLETFRAKLREITITDMKKLGLADPGAVIDAYEKNLEKWRKLSPEIGLDVDKFTAALKREIYDKIDVDDL
ncbi:C4-dicarboxylate TRAP transporter substrate-binding protein [Propylenella binzhouense]|uniref:Uncharacterized protein n=1 Tax=Propylenella binzhouense TaxID=2555902 RepID=A0A964WRW9_9HYPH|nr:C4-dicarboxylate TRAP transporter substrate-binding protein [Propylenella binzhouense]MYZ46354.1 hypothetical protein [Propylenella binzhouense]